MLQTVNETESSQVAPRSEHRERSVVEGIFDIIREQLTNSDGDAGVAFEVALDHIKAKKLQGSIFNEHGPHIVRVLWNDLGGLGEDDDSQRYPDPQKQVKGVRPQLKRYTPGSVFDKWVPIGCSGKSKLLGDLTRGDLDIIIKAYESHIEGSQKNKAKWVYLKEQLAKKRKKRVRDAVTAEEIGKLELSARQLK